MPRSLVIVESPAKARTIAGFLGSDFILKSSYGHVRDLPASGLNVDIEKDFTPTYEVSPSKREVIRELKAALKEADALYLATDEDREGEAISWHLLEVLKPRIPVRRMVFHEITRSAIDAAVANWRELDLGLVDAQETRRVLDRLYGYEVSPVLWKKVNRGLSAGRVQSVATRLVVERERERMRFVAAGYWDLDARMATDPAFTASLHEVDGSRVASGKDFDESGRVRRDDVVVLDESAATSLADALRESTFRVASIDEKPYTSKPKPPFMTSTLQQEGGRKLRMGAQQVMRVAQGLYERGYITYMRTDSTALSETALAAARAQVRELYGDAYLPDRPRTYATKVKNAQEAHEAIRPAGERWRTPDQLSGELRADDLRLYELIWKRTVASQMADARGQTVSVRIGAVASTGTETVFAASGRTITFPGYLRAYVEGSDDPDAELDDRESILPALTVGAVVPVEALDAVGHSTSPPARYTEASLVKRLEELGVGRPSTYASIMQTIQDRGYAWKRGAALIPTWTAFAVTNLLERHFADLVDYAFTARMEDDLDDIASRDKERLPWLRAFYFGNGTPGLHALVNDHIADIDPAEINAIPIGLDPDGVAIVVKPGKFGPYVRRGDDTASVPEDIAPDEFTVERALELLAAPKGTEPIGTDEATGLPVFVKSGRYGPYVQLGDADTLPDGEKPKMASLFATMSPDTVTMDDALRLLTLPRLLGTDPVDGEEVTAQNGRYGPYVKKGKESRSLETEEQLFSVTFDDALALLSKPKQYGRKRAAPAVPLRELGPDPVSGQPVVVRDGRFGPYVTDGETNASLRKGDAVGSITIDRAADLLQARRDAGPTTRARGAGGAKKAAKKAGSAKKAAPRAKKAAGARKAGGAKKAAGPVRKAASTPD
jgi:DNA topoisomerase-1